MPRLVAVLGALVAALCVSVAGAAQGRAQSIAEIIDALGDGGGNALDAAYDVAIDVDGNVYVIGYGSDNVFRIASPISCGTNGIPCSVTEIMDAGGDGIGNSVTGPESIAVDPNGNVYVASSGSSSVHRIATPDGCSTSGTPCDITQIIDATGDGAGNALAAAKGIAVDGDGNVYVGGRDSSNVFKVATPDTCSTNGRIRSS